MTQTNQGLDGETSKVGPLTNIPQFNQRFALEDFIYTIKIRECH